MRDTVRRSTQTSFVIAKRALSARRSNLLGTLITQLPNKITYKILKVS